MGDLLAQAPASGHWQVTAADLAKMIAEKKTDFLVVDVRPSPPGQQGGKIPARSTSLQRDPQRGKPEAAAARQEV